MRPRRVHQRVEDILAAAQKIQRYVAGMDLERFLTDQKTIEAVQFNFIVIGEASRHIPPEIEGRYPGIPWRKMRDMRNVVAHGYFMIATEILWETAQQDLPGIVAPLEAVLRALESMD